MADFCNLTQTQAQARTQSIQAGNITYQQNLKLQKGKTYSGTMHINFTILNKNAVFLEFIGKQITHFAINSKDVPKTDNSYEYLRKDGIIDLPKDFIEIGNNALTIDFTNNYYNDGNGFHSYTDIDGKQYIYSQGEPHWFNRLAPAFDQPDLKGTFELSATTPEDWIIITNQKASSKEMEPNNNDTLWKFPPTEVLSTYLYTVIVGPYKEIVCPSEKLYNNITMSLYCRDTLYQFAEKQQIDIFEFTSDSIRRYEELFRVKYPFSKSDTIFCPEYTVGAMENPGAITYTEHLLYKKEPSIKDITVRAMVINHELAHMWFGNMVTMKWWDDLWLNESFADFVCYLVLHDQLGNMSFEIGNGLIYGNLRKSMGYKEDQMSTTHPIANEAVDINQAWSNFDRITYAKGASTMRQLLFLIGRDNFSKSMEIYFNKFAYKNTELKDLLDIFREVVGQTDKLEEHLDFDQWKADWLKTAGLNEVTIKWDPKNTEKNAKMTQVQTCAMAEHPTLRYHKMSLGFFDSEGKQLTTKEIVLKNQAETEIEYDGSQPNLAAIVPNIGDWAYIKIILDEKSLNWVKTHLHQIEDGLTRQIIWQSLFEMVNDTRGQTSLQFIDVICQNIQNEKNTMILNNMLIMLNMTLTKFTPSEFYSEYKNKSWGSIHNMILVTEDEDIMKMLMDGFVGYCQSCSGMKVQASWFDGSYDKQAKVKPNLEQKWSILMKIWGSEDFSEEYKLKIRENLEKEDTTDYKKQYGLKLKSFMANYQEREQLWKEYYNSESAMSYYDVLHSTQGFNNTLVSYEKREPYHQKFFENLLDLCKNRGQETANSIFNGLMPRYQNSKDKVEQLEKIMTQLGDLDLYWQKKIRMEFDDSKLVHKICEYALNQSK